MEPGISGLHQKGEPAKIRPDTDQGQGSSIGAYETAQAKLQMLDIMYLVKGQAVSVSLLADRKTVEVLNLLTADQKIDSDYVEPLGKFLKTGWEFEPDVLADCIKRYVQLEGYQSCSCNIRDVQLLYLLLKTGHEKLVDILYAGRCSREARKFILGECCHADSFKELENSIEKYYVLESLQRISMFPMKLPISVNFRISSASQELEHLCFWKRLLQQC